MKSLCIVGVLVLIMLVTLNPAMAHSGGGHSGGHFGGGHFGGSNFRGGHFGHSHFFVGGGFYGYPYDYSYPYGYYASPYPYVCTPMYPPPDAYTQPYVCPQPPDDSGWPGQNGETVIP